MAFGHLRAAAAFGARAVFVALLALAATSVAADTAVPPRAAVPGDSPQQLAAIVADFERLEDSVMQTGHVVGMAVVVVKDGKVLSRRGLGTSDTRTMKPVGVDTTFRLASLSKAFAATLAGKLVEQRFIDWEDPVVDYVPAFELKDHRQATLVTVRDLLSHRVGLPHNSYDPLLERDQPYPILVYKLRDLPMICSVGDCYAYQNIAYSLIGDVTFAATGDFFSHQVERQLFHPLGMNTATYGRDALEANTDSAKPHVRRGRGWMPVRPKESYYRVPPAAGVNASITDMTQWLYAHLGHRPDVISPGLRTLLQTRVVSTPGERVSSPWRRARLQDAGYALGWRVYDYSGHELVFHAGAVQGYRAMLAMLPEHDFGVAILWNCETAVPSGLLPTLLDRYLGLPANDWIGLRRLQKPLLAAKKSRRR